MFRELTRKNNQLYREDCIRILKDEKRGVLSVNGDDGYPYGSPMNHFYNSEDGNIYFHCGKQQGHRLDALLMDAKASYCVTDSGRKTGGEWALIFNSVIVFGKVKIIDDHKKVESITYRLSRKFTQDESYIKDEISKHLKNTILLQLSPEHICGKSVIES